MPSNLTPPEVYCLSNIISDWFITWHMLVLSNQNQFSKYLRFTPLKNDTTILTVSLIGLKIYISFVLTNRPVVLRGLTKMQDTLWNCLCFICNGVSIYFTFVKFDKSYFKNYSTKRLLVFCKGWGKTYEAITLVRKMHVSVLVLGNIILAHWNDSTIKMVNFH